MRTITLTDEQYANVEATIGCLGPDARDILSCVLGAPMTRRIVGTGDGGNLEVLVTLWPSHPPEIAVRAPDGFRVWGPPLTITRDEWDD